MFLKQWVLGGADGNLIDRMRLKYYYDHSREWWGQAIWFYNKFNGDGNDHWPGPAPQDIFDVVEDAGIADDISEEYSYWTQRVLQYWDVHDAVARMLLPET